MPAVQKRAFPLAGLMCTLRGIAHAHEGKAGITVPANASSSFSRRGDEESFETSTRTKINWGSLREEDFSIITTRGGKIFLTSPLDAGNLCNSTRTREGEFSESIKKGNAYRSDHQQENQCYSPHVAAKSVTGRRNPFYLQAIPDAESVFFCIVATAHLSNAGKIRTLSMVALVGRRSRLPVSCKAGIPTPANVTANLSVGTPAV